LRRQNGPRDYQDGHPDQVLSKLDSIWDYFCISDRVLILDTYGDTHA
jgi:hypothetical protein